MRSCFIYVLCVYMRMFYICMCVVSVCTCVFVCSRVCVCFHIFVLCVFVYLHALVYFHASMFLTALCVYVWVCNVCVLIHVT